MKTHSHKILLALALGALAAPLAMAQVASQPPDQEQSTPSDPAAANTPAGTTPKSAPAKSTTGTGQKSWNDLDIDKDGSLSASEASADPGMKAIFAKADSNGDGILTADEYRAYYAKYQAASHK